MAMVNKVSSHCPSCGAGMEVDRDAGVLRCSYCQHEVLIPAAQPSAPNWAYGTSQAGPPHVTVNNRPATAPNKAALVYFIPVVAILLLGAFMLFSAVFEPSSSASDSSESDESDKPVVVAIGAAARRDSFEVTVRSVDCDKTSVAPPDDPTTTFTDESTNVIKAEGKFCMVTVSVKNVGTKTDSYSGYSLRALSSTERNLERNSGAERYVNTGIDRLSEPIDPGKVVDRVLAFDVPVDTALAYVNVFSGGYKTPEIKVKAA